MTHNMKYFKGSFIFTFLGIMAAFSIGMMESGINLAFIYAYQVLILTILEVSLSFDNAVINASVLKDMTEEWQRKFLTWGIVIAVFGMRLVFPLIIVMIAGNLSPIDALKISFTDPKAYEEIMKSSHTAIAGFGGTFLLMVFLKYFVDYEKEIHWIGFIEKPLAKIGKMDTIQIAIAALVVLMISKFIPTHETQTFIISAVWGLIVYILADGVEVFFDNEEKDAVGTVVKSVAKAGFAGFMYLEVLDASFSFDGVIGAFAITNIIWIMAIGLGSGALFVRSLTILMVDKGTLTAYKYLEHGALWAIGILSFILLIEPMYSVPEVITGLIGAVAIVIAFVSSLSAKAKQ